MVPIERENIRILLIEDNAADVRLIDELLKNSLDFQYEMKSYSRLGEGLESLKKYNFDIMLLDLSLPDSDRTSTLEKVLEYTSMIPIIILTGLDDKEIALSSLKKGIQDYLVKDQLSTNLLTRSILYGIERHRIKVAKLEEDKRTDLSLDKRDKLILNILQENYRISYVEIGKRAKLAASTVHTRVQNMINDGIIRKMDTLVDPIKVGFNTIAIANLAIAPLKLDEVSKKLTLFDEIQLVATAAGEYNLMLKIIAKNEKDLWRFLNEKVLSIEGIKRQINVSNFIDIYKMTEKIKFKIR